MRAPIQKWLIVLSIFFGVPGFLIWVTMPYLDLSHATYLAAQKDYALAIKALNRAIAFNGLLPAAYVKRGWLYDRLKQPARALEDFNTAFKMDPHNWEMLNDRAWVLAELGRFGEALLDANQAIEFNSTGADAYDTRGVVYLKLKDPVKAVSDFNMAIKLQANFGAAYFHRSLAYEQLGKKAEAQLDARRAAHLGYSEDDDDIPPLPAPAV